MLAEPQQNQIHVSIFDRLASHTQLSSMLTSGRQTEEETCKKINLDLDKYDDDSLSQTIGRTEINEFSQVTDGHVFIMARVPRWGLEENTAWFSLTLRNIAQGTTRLQRSTRLLTASYMQTAESSEGIATQGEASVQEGYLFWAGHLDTGRYIVELEGENALEEGLWDATCTEKKLGQTSEITVLASVGNKGVQTFKVKSPPLRKTNSKDEDTQLLFTDFTVRSTGFVIIGGSLLSTGRGLRILELYLDDNKIGSYPAETTEETLAQHAFIYQGNVSSGNHFVELRAAKRDQNEEVLWGPPPDAVKPEVCEGKRKTDEKCKGIWGGLDIMTFDGGKPPKKAEVISYEPFRKDAIRGNKVDNDWHSVRIDADNSGSVRFYVDSKLEETFSDNTFQSGQMQINSHCQEVEVRNVHVSSNNVCAVPTRPCVIDMPLYLGNTSTVWKRKDEGLGNGRKLDAEDDKLAGGWKTKDHGIALLDNGNVLESAQLFARPARAYAEMRLSKSLNTSLFSNTSLLGKACLAMSLFSSGYSMKLDEDALQGQLGSDNFGPQSPMSRRPGSPTSLGLKHRLNGMNLFDWHSLEIEADAHGHVRLNVNQGLVGHMKLERQDMAHQLGSLRIKAACGAVEVRNVVVSALGQCYPNTASKNSEVTELTTEEQEVSMGRQAWIG
jgi:hypothetical protein